MGTSQDIETLFNRLRWAETFIQDYVSTGEHKNFDPYRQLMGQTTDREKLYTACLNFIHDLTKASDEFDTLRNELIGGWRKEPEQLTDMEKFLFQKIKED